MTLWIAIYWIIIKISCLKTNKFVYNKRFDLIAITLYYKIIYNYSDKKPVITTSMLPSTTLNSIEIKFDDDFAPEKDDLEMIKDNGGLFYVCCR